MASSSLSVNYTPMEELFAGKSCLVTGASGFLGKVLVEKLLYSLADIELIYVIIRPQNGKDSKERLTKLLESPIFDRIRSECPARLSKIIPISGNLMESEMALSPGDVNRLCDNVAFIFHCAATIKFDEKLKVSIEMNVLGTQRLIALAHKMRCLAAFVHASTAYANCDRHRIIESVYPPPVDPHQLIQALSWMSDSMVEAISPIIVGKRPNTYTLTKALTEHLIVEECGDRIPVTIVRPSIIGATCAEPLVGWVDNLNGPTGMFAAVGKGILTNMCGDESAKADIVPVDLVVNTLICAAWHRATNKFDIVPVINCCTGRLNPIRWGQIVNYVYRFYTHVPLEGALSYPTTKFHMSKMMYNVNVTLKHKIPSYIIDTLSNLIGRKTNMVRIYSKLQAAVEVLHYFTSNEWDFQSKGMLTIWESMAIEDRQTFNIDLRQLNWDHYLHDYMLGVKRYVLKDNMECAQGAMAHISRLRAMTTIVNVLLTALAVRYMSPKAWPRQRKWTIFLAAGTLQSYLMLRVQQPLVGVEPRLHLYGQPFGPKQCRVLTSTQSERDLKSCK